MKWVDPRFAGYEPKTGIRLPPRPVAPSFYMITKKGDEIPVYDLIWVDKTKYNGRALREIRKTHR